MVYDLEAFETLIKSRRSVFPQDYTGEPVDDLIVKKILETAIWAPTHKLTQPWRFIVFTGAAIKSFAEAQAAIYKRVTEADGTFKESKYQSLQTKPLLSSHIIAVIMHRDEKKSVPEIEEVGAVFCAVQNIYLATTAYGIGGYFSTGGVTYFNETKTLLEIDPGDKVLGFFHLGVPARIPSSLRRKPLDEVTRWLNQ
jgi:nitroreductase